MPPTPAPSPTILPSPSPEALRDRARRLGLFGLLAAWDEVQAEPWLVRLLHYEERERQRRSLERRLKNARLGAFKPIADFDWKWPKKIDRRAVEELFALEFLTEAANVVLLGPNGVGKTMIAKNLAHQALLRGYTVRFTTASDMLHDLASKTTDYSLAQRLRRYCAPQLGRRRDRLSLLRRPLRRPPLRGRHPSLREPLDHPRHQQALRRVEGHLPQCGLCRHSRRSPPAQGRTRSHRRRKLSPQGGQGSRREKTKGATTIMNPSGAHHAFQRIRALSLHR
jgi:hypothetical protein